MRVPAAWAARNCRQVGDRRRGAGVEPGPGQDRPDRSRANPVTRDRGAHRGCGGAPTAGFAWPAAGPARGSPPGWAAVRWGSGGSLALDQAPVPGEQGAGCHDPVQPQVPVQQPRQRGDHGPVSPVLLRAGGLTRRTATSCRSTKISTFRRAATDKPHQPGDRTGTARRMSTNVEGRSPGQIVCTSSGT